MTATTALTAQNTRGVRDIHHVPVAFVREAMEACLEDVGVDVVKTGEFSISVRPVVSCEVRGWAGRKADEEGRYAGFC